MPVKLAAALMPASLLRRDAVRRKVFRKPCHDRLLAALIRLGDQIHVALVFDLRWPILFAQDLACVSVVSTATSRKLRGVVSADLVTISF
jgi:hypothetical protein